MTVMTFLPKMRAERLAYADGGCGLAFAERGGGDGGHINILAVLALGETIQNFEFDLGLVRAEEFEFAFLDSQFLRDLENGFEFSGLCDLNIRRHRLEQFQFGWGVGEFFDGRFLDRHFLLDDRLLVPQLSWRAFLLSRLP